jgi:hypothetical protein
MKKKMKTGVVLAFAWIAGILLAGTLLLIVIIFPFRGSFGTTDYSTAKEHSFSIFERRIDALIKAKDNAISKGTAENINVRNIDEIMYGYNGFNFIVNFRIGTHGNQEWGIYYVSNDLPSAHILLGSSAVTDYSLFKNGPYDNSYFYSKETGDRVAFFATERIIEGWFFYYDDDNGNRHGLDWGTMKN